VRHRAETHGNLIEDARMGRKIVVSSNCQTGGIAAALTAMMPDDAVVARPWIGADASEPDLRRELRDADVWVTAADDASRAALLPSGRTIDVVRVPRIVFTAFHPDTIRVAGPDGAWLPSAVARLHSAIVVWGWRNGIGAGEIVDRFTPAVMEGLGYTAGWEPAVAQLRDAFATSDVDFEPFFLAVRRATPFMLTVNHARVAVLVHLARPVARRLGAPAERVEFPWETTLPDRPMTNGPFWPVYPVVAASLGVPGGFVWRPPGGGYLGLEQFVRASLDRYANVDPATVVAPALDDPRFDAVLGDALVAS
jgi:hypothetical protein